MLGRTLLLPVTKLQIHIFPSNKNAIHNTVRVQLTMLALGQTDDTPTSNIPLSVHVIPKKLGSLETLTENAVDRIVGHKIKKTLKFKI